jgi:3,4-dihydroxy 2-butanone 4-phosphate synthase/GTP cyclohydrolase II
MGDVDGEDILCRIHSHCTGAHVFNSIECDCREQLNSAQEMIQQEGRGVIIWLDQEGKGNGHLALLESIPFKKEFGQAEAYVRAGYQADARNYSAAAKILADLNVRSIILLANGRSKAEQLAREGIAVSGSRSLNIAE